MSAIPFVIEASTLFARLEEGADLVVVDCRFRLDDHDYGTRAYQAGHIPGALYAHLENDLSGPKGARGGRHPLPAQESFARFLQRIGVQEGTHVIAYDEEGEMAARLWWLLHYYGHPEVSVLQGGIKAWLDQGYPLTDHTEVPQRSVPPVSLHIDNEWLATHEEVQQGTHQGNPPGWLLDARAQPRFRGDVEPLDPKAGHIPGAQCYFWQEALAGPARYKSLEELRRHFTAVPKKPIVYCGSGVTACVDVLALRQIGIAARLYAGSWSDWCADEQSAIAKGEAH